MNVSDIHRIAELARLRFTDAEAEAFAEQFSSIVDYVGAINSVDMSGVEPLTSVNNTVNVLREDIVGECLTTEEALRNAPRKNEAFIKVPKVLG
ncbi:MAG: Asp-tRNA(Asn)/Glu-tRNA(Gln) amidotransferase subunit GatC [Ignavibacteria bacterium]|nr:Asp-tRNA(Asn)/Glu-tRNA(Gln) amidotransferase subunit GatC [Ignavibacteria bacterium]MBP6510656.1 Asp-tRNA(Asn)/Glu-tRNA(Gln) amidotransferase subunit GatC [Candidatus Kapabacteria bacterium]MBK6420509.1 Asp-tRNA(Asn)/Glu-tRNA(Gln) amidotransferase subunit GatC [Ignavibacteria bacterium]MBK6761535.1 Asp-tRNA(Asn)/Glu-tRNA(Gln) amidotransferase subunit GatC [Ignavibacteria bacterium]MBK7033559.1 Asp-tRNA(Asn)/Glu-tRNA(Gln) amidotransferase subunit GatC [Ignavibacteria bacterium]